MKIGILGGGQLAKMMIEAGIKYDYKFVVFSLEKFSPSREIAVQIVGDWNSKSHLKIFAKMCDIITLENEFIDHKLIRYIEKTGKKCYPKSRTIKLIQDKLIQKQTMKNFNVPTADFMEVNSIEDILTAAKKFKYPIILKSRTMGYDGKGNIKIDSEEDISRAYKKLIKRGKLFCEKFIKFKKEIAVQAVRSISGEIKIYPVVETIQENHICNIVLAKNKANKLLTEKVNKLAKKILKKLNYVGVFGIEMFLTGGNNVLVNELAPRVHNSGHYTIEGCKCSQFENHIRAILNLPLGSTEMINGAAVMINILGERNAPAHTRGINRLLNYKNAYLHIYGKQETHKGRKMGHITVLGDSLGQTKKLALKYRKLIKI
jgi:5-(carboxyamino)imidazole ribonucleotide synthase